MDEWVKLTIFLCVYGFMKEIGPDDPFILHHLDNREQNEARIWEVLTQLILTTMLFFCADYFRYKPFIVIGAVFGLAAQIINLVSEDTFALMGRQCLYGAAKAAEVAYFSYIYAKVPKINYTKVTSFCQAAAVAGGIFSALVSLWPLPGLWSNYVTIIVLAFAVCWLVLLPKAETTLYFHRARIVSLGGQAENIQAGPAPKPSITDVQQLLWEDFKAAYYNPYTLGFCVYVVMMTAAFSQMVICVQLLGVFLHGSPVATGIPQILNIICGFVSSLLMGYFGLKFKSKKTTYILLGSCGLLQGCTLLLCAGTGSWLVVCFTYIFCGILHNVTQIIANSEIASRINPDSYGLVIGLNNTLSLVIQVMITTMAGIKTFVSPSTQLTCIGITEICSGIMYITGLWIMKKFNVPLNLDNEDSEAQARNSLPMAEVKAAVPQEGETSSISSSDWLSRYCWFL